MKENTSKINRIISYIVPGFMVFMLLTIVLRIFARQVLVERLSMDNAFVRAVFFDADNLVNEETFNDEDRIDWEKLYPFEEEELIVVESDTQVTPKTHRTINIPFTDTGYNRIVNRLEDKIETYSTDYLMGFGYGVTIGKGIDKVLNWNDPVSPEDFTRIIRLNNDYLTYVQPLVDETSIESIALAVKDFDNFLKEEDIKFFVVNNASKINPKDTQLSRYEARYEHTNENGSNLLNALKRRGIKVLDMRTELLNADREWYEFYYKTDHHWTPQAGLYAAGCYAEFLNVEAGLNYDLDKFSSENFSFATYPDLMFGSQGRNVTLANASMEDYTLVLPKYETNLTYDIVDKGESYEGPYEESLFDMKALEETAAYNVADLLNKPDPYCSTRIDNYPISHIRNNMENGNTDVKILIIDDSFGWYPASFLALDTGEIDLLYPIAFTGSIRSYIKETRPDVVILAPSERAINPIDYSSHESFFDLR